MNLISELVKKDKVNRQAYIPKLSNCKTFPIESSEWKVFAYYYYSI